MAVQYLTWTFLLLMMMTLNQSDAFPEFVSKIPGAKFVFNPRSKQAHPAVGHILEQGSGKRNCFGKDFQKAGNRWTLDLCQKDSDGDGKSNGAELGDPMCKWSEKNNISLAIVPKGSHPGVCTPLESETCRFFNNPNSTCVRTIRTIPNTSVNVGSLGAWICLIVILSLMWA